MLQAFPLPSHFVSAGTIAWGSVNSLGACYCQDIGSESGIEMAHAHSTGPQNRIHMRPVRRVR